MIPCPIGHVDNSSYTNISLAIQLSLTLPADAAGPSPVILTVSRIQCYRVGVLWCQSRIGR